MAAEVVYSRENADDGSYYKADCGCEIWTQCAGDKFVIEPCSLSCENYQYAVRQSRAKGNPLQFRYTE